MTIARVQVAQTSRQEGVGPLSLALTLSPDPVQNNTLLLVVARRTVSPPNIVDGGFAAIVQSGVTWELIGQRNFNNPTLRVETYAGRITSESAADTITLPLNLDRATAAIVVEYNDIIKFGALRDESASLGSSGSGIADTNTTGVTTQAEELFQGIIVNLHGSTTQLGATNGFTEVAQETTDPVGGALDFNLGIYEKIVSAVGTAGMEATLSVSRPWGGIIQTYFEDLSTEVTVGSSLDMIISEPLDIGAFLDVVTASEITNNVNLDMIVRGLNELVSANLNVFSIPPLTEPARIVVLNASIAAGGVIPKAHVPAVLDMWIDPTIFPFPHPDLTSVDGLLKAGVDVSVEGAVWPAPVLGAPLTIPNGVTASNAGAGALTGTFRYAVTAVVFADVESDVSAQVSFTASSQDILVRWNAVPGATAYRVYKQATPGPNPPDGFNEVFVVGVSPSPFFVDTGAAGSAAGRNPPFIVLRSGLDMVVDQGFTNGGFATAEMSLPFQSFLANGETFTLVDASGASRVFEFDTSGTGPFTPGVVHVDISADNTDVEVAVTTAAAINTNFFSAPVPTTNTFIITQSASGISGNQSNSDTVVDSSAVFNLDDFTGAFADLLPSEIEALCYTALLDVYVQAAGVQKTASLEVSLAAQPTRTASLSTHIGTTTGGGSPPPGDNPQRVSSSLDVAILPLTVLGNIGSTPGGSQYINCQPLWCNVPKQVKFGVRMEISILDFFQRQLASSLDMWISNIAVDPLLPVPADPPNGEGILIVAYRPGGSADRILLQDDESNPRFPTLFPIGAKFTTTGSTTPANDAFYEVTGIVTSPGGLFFMNVTPAPNTIEAGGSAEIGFDIGTTAAALQILIDIENPHKTRTASLSINIS